MSRALDQETTAALRSVDPAAAYSAIARLLTELAPPQLLEIEFLGPGSVGEAGDATEAETDRYYLRDGNSVGIRKLALVPAFFEARRILQRFQAATAAEAEKAGKAGKAGQPEELEKHDVMAATAVLLLFDPEHQTAANTRKRVLQAGLQQKERTDRAAWTRERCFVDSLLTSHLHRHTKSPTLWSHRRWLVLQGGRRDEALRLRQDMTSLVMVAGQRHPRNYYAWGHLRWLVEQFCETAEDSRLADFVPAVRTWCFQHHDDTSGWSFLLFLLLRPSVPAGCVQATVDLVLQRAADLRWTNESVWAFLRTAATVLDLPASTSTSNSTSQRLRQTARSLQSRVDPTTQEWRVLQAAQNWCISYPVASTKSRT